MSKVCFIIFAHSTDQDVEDLQDMIKNIRYFHDDCDFIINHSNIVHKKVIIFNLNLGVH